MKKTEVIGCNEVVQRRALLICCDEKTLPRKNSNSSSTVPSFSVLPKRDNARPFGGYENGGLR